MKFFCLNVFIMAALASTGVSAETGRARFSDSPHSGASTFTRLFPNLPPFALPTDEVRNFAAQSGARNGIMDARDNLIDSKISSVLFELPGSVVPAPGLPSDGVLSLPSRKHIRHVDFGLPSGQDVARTIGASPLGPAELIDLAPYGMADSTPLWFFVVREAEIQKQGHRLGQVGATIVGEVFMGLLRSDPDSYLNQQPEWTPDLESQQGSGQFGIADLLTMAGVVHPL